MNNPLKVGTAIVFLSFLLLVLVSGCVSNQSHMDIGMTGVTGETTWETEPVEPVAAPTITQSNVSTNNQTATTEVVTQLITTLVPVVVVIGVLGSLLSTATRRRGV